MSWLKQIYFAFIRWSLTSTIDVIALETAYQVKRITAPLAAPLAEWSTVLALSPNGCTLSQRVLIKPGYSEWVRFMPQTIVDKGTWVVVLGPSHVTEVRVGNNSQCGSYPFSGPVCVTRDKLEIGSYLSVQVKGNES